MYTHESRAEVGEPHAPVASRTANRVQRQVMKHLGAGVAGALLECVNERIVRAIRFDGHTDFGKRARRRATIGLPSRAALGGDAYAIHGRALAKAEAKGRV